MPLQVVGLGVSGTPEVAIVHAPLSLLPVAFPRQRFEQVRSVMVILHTSHWSGHGGTAPLQSPDDAGARGEAWLQPGLVLPLRPHPQAPMNPLSVHTHQPFLQAKAAQPAFNRLVDAVAQDEAWLEATLQLAAQHDDFTGRLLQVGHVHARVCVGGGGSRVGPRLAGDRCAARGATCSFHQELLQGRHLVRGLAKGSLSIQGTS